MKTLIKLYQIIKLGVILLLSYIMTFLDRILMAPFTNVELPTAKEINTFEHYRNQVTKRTAIYFVILALGLMVWVVVKFIQYLF